MISVDYAARGLIRSELLTLSLGLGLLKVLQNYDKSCNSLKYFKDVRYKSCVVVYGKWQSASLYEYNKLGRTIQFGIPTLMY